jgi:hypothetical protein
MENTEPREICKFTNSNSPFIVDIHASVSCASFALSSKGELYRWGKDQVEETAMPILDRFGSIINYSATPISYRCYSPNKVNKSFLRDGIKQISSGNSFYFALDTKGVLYGWGICKFLGINNLLDKQEKIVIDIVNPIELMKDIEFVSAGFDHVVAFTKDRRIIGWGNVSSFSRKELKFAWLPLDIT